MDGDPPSGSKRLAGLVSGCRTRSRQRPAFAVCTDALPGRAALAASGMTGTVLPETRPPAREQ
jgi:hypothetical protein